MKSIIHHLDFAFYTKKEEEIIGTLIPISWNDDGGIAKFGIYSLADEDIIIESNYTSKDLKQLLKSKVIAKGKTWKTSENEKRINLMFIERIVDNGPNTFASPYEKLLDHDVSSYSIGFPNEYATTNKVDLVNELFETG